MTGGLHEVLVRPSPVLVQETVESLLVDARLRELHLGVLPVRSVHGSCTANLRDFFSVAVKAPATNLVAADHILDEKHPITEPETEKRVLNGTRLWLVRS